MRKQEALLQRHHDTFSTGNFPILQNNPERLLVFFIHVEQLCQLPAVAQVVCRTSEAGVGHPGLSQL